MSRIDYILNCIEKGETPSITPETNEEVRLLKVAKGIANGGSSGGAGGGMFIVNHTAKDENYCQLDKTFDEIKTAFESGMLPILFDNDTKMVAYLNTIEDHNIQFINNNNEQYNVDSNNEATCYEHQGEWGNGDW